MNDVVTDDAWVEARVALLEKEKALTRLRDEVAASRRAMPWRKVSEDYVFEGPEGPVPLSELFAGRSQLVLVHFMYGPGWSEGCKSCSFWADQYDALIPHLGGRDVSLAVVSRAPLADFLGFKARMGWQFSWLSSAGNSFNQDYHVSFPNQDKGVYNYREGDIMEEQPGISVFVKDAEGQIYHTYSVYARGLDPLNATYQFLDLVPKRRDEAELPFSMAWVQHHDKYA